jgi:tRNA-2-methylthio-N6-dimethylallyladenosine synthase
MTFLWKQKKRRLAEVIDKQSELSIARNLLDVGQEQVILIDGASKKSGEELRGRNSANKVVIVTSEGIQQGDYVRVKITGSSRGTLFGAVIEINPSNLV